MKSECDIWDQMLEKVETGKHRFLGQGARESIRAKIQFHTKYTRNGKHNLLERLNETQPNRSKDQKPGKETPSDPARRSESRAIKLQNFPRGSASEYL